MNIYNFAAAVNWKRPWTSGSATHVVNARSSANSYHKRWVSHIILSGWSEIVTLCFDFGRQFCYPLISLRIAFTYTYFLIILIRTLCIVNFKPFDNTLGHSSVCRILYTGISLFYKIFFFLNCAMLFKIYVPGMYIHIYMQIC